MNYLEVYNSLITKALVRGTVVGYYEEHHIIPKCLGGVDESSNLVKLTGREHYVAHLLLWKIYPDNRKIFHAAWMMSNRKLTKCHSRTYESLRVSHSKILSERSGVNSPNYKDLTGHRSGRLLVISPAGWEDEPRGFKVSLWNCQCNCGNVVIRKARDLNGKTAIRSCGCLHKEIMVGRVGEANNFFGREHSEESKKMMADARRGKLPSNAGQPKSSECIRKIKETKAKNPTLWTEERRKLMSEKMKGRKPTCVNTPQSKETIEKRKLAIKLRNLRPWESGHVKHSSISMLLWVNADLIYSLWLENDMPKERGMWTIFSRLYNIELKVTSFKGLCRHFGNGFNPSNDLDWLKFHQENKERHRLSDH